MSRSRIFLIIYLTDCVPSKAKNVNLKVFNMTIKNESKLSVKHVPCAC